jgi:hypothetical protein
MKGMRFVAVFVITVSETPPLMRTVIVPGAASVLMGMTYCLSVSSVLAIYSRRRYRQMNNLNSIVIEGVVSGTLKLYGRGKYKRCSFTLSSLRCWYPDGKIVRKQETRVGVMIRDTKLVEVAVEQATDGHDVRVVGRLANVEQGGGIYIEAEHVEYRPEPKDRR